MSAENLSWVLPAIKGAYEKREVIEGIWAQISAYLRGEQKRIAFLGHAGAGKTVLFDHLTGEGYKQGYRPPGTSQKEEKGWVSLEKKRLCITTVPGQQSVPRFDALEDVFSDKTPVDGVVHVVSNGYVDTRDPIAQEALIKNAHIDTTEKYRVAQLATELSDLECTCEIIRKALRNHRKPKWLLVAVTKVDLYYGTLETARSYYSPHGNSAFSARLNTLQQQVGSDNFQWSAAPVCCSLEDFLWNGETTPSTLKPEQRDHYVAGFAKELKRFC